MLTSNAVSLIIAIMALVISSTSSVYQIRELRQQTNKADAQIASGTDASVQMTFQHMSRVFIEYPEIRPLFQPSDIFPAPEVSTLDNSTRLRAETLCDDLLDCFENAYRAEKDERFQWSGPLWNYYDNIMKRSEFLYNYFYNHRDWWPNDLYTRALDARNSRGDGTPGH